MRAFHRVSALAALALCVSLCAQAEAGYRTRGVLTVYLSPGGVMLRAGADDAVRGTSEALRDNGRGAVMVPAFPFGQAMWNDVVRCAQQRFAPFPIRITDRRPTTGPYPMVVVAGSQKLFGDATAHGRMMMTPGRIYDRAVGFVYAHEIKRMARGRGKRALRDNLCGAIAHEIGHALGLEHVSGCVEVMRGGKVPAMCIPQVFSDKALPCIGGQCKSGRRTQNSFRYLQRALHDYATREVRVVYH